MQGIHPDLKECFGCGGKEFKKHLSLKDYFLTQEDFNLFRCSICGLLYTLPRPAANKINSYYESEEYTSHNTNQSSLKNVLYKLARKKALNRKLGMIQNHVSKGSMLDIGSGTGEFLEHCKNRGWEVIGVEPNDTAREKAINSYGLKIMDNKALKELPKGSYDVITMWHVLEHIEDPLAQVKLNHELLKPGGLFVLALPNYESWDANHYGKFWAAYDVPRHLYHFTRESVQYLSDKTDFNIEEILPLKLDAYYISLLSEKYMNKKPNYIMAAKIGWKSNHAAKMGKFGYSSWVYFLKKK
jgi:2-polyprenyl-3-methyl-5-hydroxy-6-metoxy-1,4-benzoquinol methylase